MFRASKSQTQSKMASTYSPWTRTLNLTQTAESPSESRPSCNLPTQRARKWRSPKRKMKHFRKSKTIAKSWQSLKNTSASDHKTWSSTFQKTSSSQPKFPNETYRLHLRTHRDCLLTWVASSSMWVTLRLYANSWLSLLILSNLSFYCIDASGLCRTPATSWLSRPLQNWTTVSVS